MWLEADDTAANEALQLHVNTSLSRPSDRTWRRPPGRLRNKWLDQFRNDSTRLIENLTPGGVLSTVDTVVQRRDGPRRLRDYDDDDDDVVCCGLLRFSGGSVVVHVGGRPMCSQRAAQSVYKQLFAADLVV